MSREKQIEEQAIEDMVRVIEITEQVARDAHCGLPSPRMYAKALYWKGYRKQSEGEWIFEHEFYGKTLCSNCKEEALVNENNEYVDSDFCPNCGAKMKGDSDIELWTFTVWDDNGLTKSFTKTVKKGGVE